MCENIATHAVLHYGQRASYACAEHVEQMRETAMPFIVFSLISRAVLAQRGKTDL